MAEHNVKVDQVVTVKGDEHEVRSSCGGAGGHWYCVTHDEMFANNLSVEGHVSSGDHEMTWWCAEHGPEVP